MKAIDKITILASMTTTFGIYLYSTLRQAFLVCHATRSRNLWSVPKGLKDNESEDGLDAAFREFYEETNILRSQINILLTESLPPQKYLKQNKVLESFLVVSDTDFDTIQLKCHSLVNNSFPEIDRYRWVNAEEFAGIAHEAQVRNIPLITRILSDKGFLSRS